MNKFFSKIFIICLICWLVLAVFRLGFNYVKIFTEEKQWVFLSEDERKSKLYGDIWQIYLKYNSVSTLNDSLLIKNGDQQAYFLLRYLLYPKKVYWDKENNVTQRKISYILLYKQNGSGGYKLYKNDN